MRNELPAAHLHANASHVINWPDIIVRVRRQFVTHITNHKNYTQQPYRAAGLINFGLTDALLAF